MIVVNDYNMVGVVVAMVISTMHEKSCIDLHNAWFKKFGYNPPDQSAQKMSHEIINKNKNQFESIQTTFICSIYDLQIKYIYIYSIGHQIIFAKKKRSILTVAIFWQSLLQQQNG